MAEPADAGPNADRPERGADDAQTTNATDELATTAIDEQGTNATDELATTVTDETAQPRRGSRGYLAVLIALTTVAVILVAFGFVFGLKMMQNDAEQARRQTVVRTAGEVALKLTTIDHRNADRDLQRLREVATPQFAEQFGIRSHAFADTLQQSQIVSTGQVTSAGLEQFQERSARVLVAVRATVRDGGAPRGDPRNYRLGVDLVRQDDKWLVSNVEFIL